MNHELRNALTSIIKQFRLTDRSTPAKLRHSIILLRYKMPQYSQKNAMAMLKRMLKIKPKKG